MEVLLLLIALIVQIIYESLFYTLFLVLFVIFPTLCLLDIFVVTPIRRTYLRSLPPIEDESNFARYPYLIPKYSLPAAKAPRSKGVQLIIMAYLLHYLPSLRVLLRKQNHLTELNEIHIGEAPTFIPRHFIDENKQIDEITKFERDIENYPQIRSHVKDLGCKLEDERRLMNFFLFQHFLLENIDFFINQSHSQGFKFNGILDYYRAYKNNTTTPLKVAKNLISAVKDSNGQHNLNAIIEINEVFILKQAEESTNRFQNGTERSILEGIPISLKDQIHCSQFKTSKGRSVFSVDSEDATVVQRLIQVGGIIFGKANQTEMGIHVTGMNANQRYKHCKNPYTLKHQTGGSSSGSGSAVACGLGPVSIAADGGGSIRLPSGICGVVGIKPTCGRVSLAGDTACFGSSVDVVGPIGANAIDAAIVLALISGRDRRDPITYHSPFLFKWNELCNFVPNSSVMMINNNDNVERKDALGGIRIGYYEEWFEDADREVVRMCKDALQKLQSKGAKLVPIRINEIHQFILSHIITITSEMVTDEHLDVQFNISSFTPTTRILFELMKDNSAIQYIQAAKMKTRIIHQLCKILSEVDVIATPTLSILPPIIPHDVPDGSDESDLVKQTGIMKYAHSPNLTGLPAITVPVGFDADNRPVSLQMISNPWEEDFLFRIALASSELVIRSKPALYFDLLE